MFDSLPSSSSEVSPVPSVRLEALSLPSNILSAAPSFTPLPSSTTLGRAHSNHRRVGSLNPRFPGQNLIRALGGDIEFAVSEGGSEIAGAVGMFVWGKRRRGRVGESFFKLDASVQFELTFVLSLLTDTISNRSPPLPQPD